MTGLEAGPLTEEHRAAMLELGTSTLFEAGRATNAVEALDPQIRPVWSGARICGPAYPVTCTPGDNFAVHRGLERCPAGWVLVAAGGGAIVGYWGEILTVAAQERGVAGFVVDGGARDIDALQDRGFPVFARGVGMRGATKTAPGRVGRPAVVGGATVAVGDIVVADTDGVAIIAQDGIAEVLAAARSRQVAEQEMVRQLKAGVSTMDLFRLREFDPDRWGDRPRA